MSNSVQNKLIVEMQESIKRAVPFSTTFLFLQEGCRDVGQETDLAKSIEAAMKRNFDIWVSTWITPRLQELQQSLAEQNTDPNQLFTDWLRSVSRCESARK